MKLLIFRVFVILFFISIGVTTGLAIKDTNAVDKIRFWLRPVVIMSGELVEGPVNGYVMVHMTGTKVRGEECEYKGIQAQGDRIIGLPVDLRSQRVDIPETGTTKSAGEYDIGVWKIWPVDGIYRIRVNVGHDCQGSKVATEIARITLN